jgi:hypothetical protein
MVSTRKAAASREKEEKQEKTRKDMTMVCLLGAFSALSVGTYCKQVKTRMCAVS